MIISVKAITFHDTFHLNYTISWSNTEISMSLHIKLCENMEYH